MSENRRPDTKRGLLPVFDHSWFVPANSPLFRNRVALDRQSLVRRSREVDGVAGRHASLTIAQRPSNERLDHTSAAMNKTETPKCLTHTHDGALVAAIRIASRSISVRYSRQPVRSRSPTNEYEQRGHLSVSASRHRVFAYLNDFADKTCTNSSTRNRQHYSFACFR